jgi:hypothetical protein
MKSRTQLILSAAVVTFSAQPSLASPCSHQPCVWVQVNAKIQARVAAGRSHQGTSPTPPSADTEFDRGGPENAC